MKPAFIFDLDGVITDTAELHFKAWQQLAIKIGITLHPKINEQLKGLSRMDSLKIILETHQLSERFSKEEKQRLASYKNDLYKESIVSLTPESILPGISALIQHIKSHNHPIGIASASHNAPAILQALGLREQFDVIADPSSIKHGKPAPDIFLLAAELLNMEPKNCIGIEDAKSGVQAIKKAGMFAIGIGDEEILSEADLNYKTTEMLTYKSIIHKLAV